MIRRAGWLLLIIILAVGQPVGGLAQSPPELSEFDLLSADTGWVRLGQQLYWTQTGGETWQEITPTNLGRYQVQAVWFNGDHTGWLALTRLDATGRPSYALARTVDGGVSWAVTSLRLDSPGLAEAIDLFFVDNHTGWLVIKQATSANFSLGALFGTTDGGRTWAKLALPGGGPVHFVTPNLGWMLAGPTGDQLFRSQDGGRSWQAQPVAPGGVYQLPVFTDARHGLLPVQAGTQTMFYHTADGGDTWQPGLTGAAVEPPPLPAGLTAPDMADAANGWAGSQTGACQTEAGGRRCLQESGLLRTRDGGRTWTPLPLPGHPAGGRLIRATWLPVDPAGVVAAAGGSETAVVSGHGFDKCEIASLSQLQNWRINSPYRAVNLYIGGISRYCANAALSAALITQLSQQGWQFIPTWVGPQAACTSYTWRMSSDLATAYSQGQAEAVAAIAAAHNLGLTLPDQSGTIIYYDLEYFDTANTACHNAARAFIAGWVAGLRGANNLAGVYSTGPVLNGMADIPNVPDAIWPAHWLYSSYNSAATVWDVYQLSNSLWNQQQRLRQYTGGHNESWGGVTLNIDSDVLAGIVAAPHRQKVWLPLILHEVAAE